MVVAEQLIHVIVECLFRRDVNWFRLCITRWQESKGIVTWNCEADSIYQDVHFTDDDNIWSALEHDNELMDNGALDAHWGAEKKLTILVGELW
jgi:hypothetical protein